MTKSSKFTKYIYINDSKLRCKYSLVIIIILKIEPYQKMNKILQNPVILNEFHDFVRF